MSVLQFGEFQFDLTLSRLSTEFTEVNLDPRQTALLQYFVANPHRIINRDELQNEIWNGVIVTDNAINKLVANLRKALGDDAKEPTYIQTVPKLGYRFVCDVVAIERNESLLSPAYKNSQHKLNIKLISSIFIGVLLVLVVAFSMFKNEHHYGDTQTLSRFHGSKSPPVFVDDIGNMLFINATQRGKTLWLSDGKSALPREVDMTKHYIDELVGFSNGKLLYKGYSSECGWFVTDVDIESGQLSDDRVEFSLCGERTIHNSKFDTRSETLYVLAHAKRHEHDNQLYMSRMGEELQQINLDLGAHWRIASLDIHPINNELLITAHSLAGKTGAFVYQTSSGKLEKLKEFASIVEHVTWDHQAQGVVYITPAPTSRLMYQSLNTQDSSLIANVNERLCCNIVRHPNQVDYVFVSSDKNIDIKWLATNYALDNSSVIDREPLFAHTKSGHYFLSNRSGHSQVYFQAPGESARLVTELAHNSRIKAMALSQDDTLLLLRGKHRLWLVPTQREGSIKNTYIEGYTYAQHWLTNTLFSITIKQQDKRHVWIMNTDMQKVAQLHDDFTHILVDPKNPNIHFYVDRENKIYRASVEQMLLNVGKEQLSFIGDLPEFSQLLIEDHILYLVSLYGETLTTYKLGDALQLLAKQPINAYLGFDVKDSQVIYAGKTHYRSEVYRTKATQ
ncbi:hypothetical protein PA25_15900 [Pseudoalteromonas sp. A25]|uniref:winged helix-turn-helix domain-containing protein n=1 Tax=Pseudoalteromonas sp. A25 TaxID=116092 RepID=UPI001260DE11|nr:winged helix-turn-helix domain-containing protein [Pseudoalteromonas sp. A25]BBN81605.1 hypothetical protein PA25_15900 [Pseudoalteromonas sp. A25]